MVAGTEIHAMRMENSILLRVLSDVSPPLFCEPCYG